jgi:hypothetical protein
LFGLTIEDLVARTPTDAERPELFKATLHQLKITPPSAGESNQQISEGSVTNNEAPTSEMLNGLGISHMSRFQHLGDVGDLDQSIHYYTWAVALTSANMPNAYLSLFTLAEALLRRFERLGEFQDVEHAVYLSRQAVYLITSDDSRMPSSLDTLGTCLISRFDRRGQISDLDQAASCFKTSV